MSAKQLVDREVIYCVSNLMYELRNVAEKLDDYDTYLNLVSGRPDYETAAQAEGWVMLDDGETIFKPGQDPWDSEVVETLEQMGYVMDYDHETGEYMITGPSGDVVLLVLEESDEAAWEHFSRTYPEAWEDAKKVWAKENGEEVSSWEAACSADNVDPDYDDIYEHWIVTSWLGDRLRDKGEIVEEYLGLTIWGRCTTGQSISMDYVIEQIAKECYGTE